MLCPLHTLVVRKDSEQFNRDFRVRRTVVHEALTWLLENNRYYGANAVHLNEEALQQLPRDGNLTDIQSLHLGAHLSTSSKEQRQCSSPFKISRVDHPTPLCRRGAPINEFTTEGYFRMAFPTLFPTGAADFLGQHCNQVTIGNYFTHLLKYKDARHPRFRFFCFEHRDEVACSSSWKNLHPTTPR